MSKDPEEQHEPIVDDESLSDPRFIKGAWQAYEWAVEDGQPDVANRLAEELARAWEKGVNIFDNREGK